MLALTLLWFPGSLGPLGAKQPPRASAPRGRRQTQRCLVNVLPRASLPGSRGPGGGSCSWLLWQVGRAVPGWRGRGRSALPTPRAERAAFAALSLAQR